MIDKEILEGNTLIGVFMGAEFCNDDTEYYPDGYYWTPYTEDKFYLPSMLPKDWEFHESWDWLMPVVIKIYTLETGVENELIIRDALADASIVGTFDAVVEFIKWYNDRKK